MNNNFRPFIVLSSLLTAVYRFVIYNADLEETVIGKSDNQVQVQLLYQMGDFDLDLLIREIGPFGKYQLINYVLLCIPILWTTMYSLAYVFTAGDLSYRCKIPACDTNELIDDPMQSSFLNFTVPKDVQSGKFSQCQQFRPINDYGCQPEDFDSSAVDTCSEFVYESGEETILSSFQLTCDQEWKLSLVGTINNIGQFVCLPLTGFISDKYGRKTVFVLGILASGIMGFIRGFSVNYPMFAVFEFLEPALGSSVYSSGFILGKAESTFAKYRSHIPNNYSNGVRGSNKASPGHILSEYLLHSWNGPARSTCICH